MKTIFIHIGTNKTGSSTLQATFCENRKYLRENNLFYPQTKKGKDAHYNLSACMGIGSEVIKQNPTEVWGEFFERFEESGCDRALISSEDFCLASPVIIRQIRELTADYKTKIVVYLRRQDTWLESYYKQGVLMGYASVLKSLEYCFENPEKTISINLDYNIFLDPWIKVFGKNNITIRPYEKSQFIGDNICNDFLSIFDLSVSILQKKVEDKNIIADSYFIYYLANSELPLENNVNNLQKRINVIKKFVCKGYSVLNSKSSNSIMMTPELSKKILKKYEEINRLIGKEFLQQDSLFINNNPIDFDNCIKFEEPSKSEIIQKITSYLLAENEKKEERLSINDLFDENLVNFLVKKTESFKKEITKSLRIEERAQEIFQKSSLFDVEWYKCMNPDVVASNMDPIKHYLEYGWKEGRDPSPSFNTRKYLEENSFLIAQNQCPLLHKITLNIIEEFFRLESCFEDPV